MTATPTAVAKYTSDGIVITAQNAAMPLTHVDAQDGADNEIEMFFDNPTHGQVLLNERFALLSQISAVHEGVEVDETLGLGSTIALTPNVPSFHVIDANRGVDKVARTRAFAYDGETDRYSVEVLE